MTLAEIYLLCVGFLFTFFIPGILVVETFYKEFAIWQKVPLYLLLSVLVSTYMVYFLSLIFGFERRTVFLAFYLMIPWLVWLIRRGVRVKLGNYRWVLFAAAAVFGLYLWAMYRAIFYFVDGYYVLSAVNWQDTAMHIGIMESLTQGNFPPQAPYFSGVPLSYYYFSDFHSAIIAVLVGSFFPRILVWDNPFFAFIFFLSVYFLARTVTRSNRASLLASFLALFNGNSMYTRFLQDYLHGSGDLGSRAVDLIANRSYTMEYGKLIQMVPMADYFLQNRPMMVGLSAVTLATSVLLISTSKNWNKRLILAGFMVGMMAKFQLFALVVGVFAIGLIVLLKWKIGDWKWLISSVVLSAVPVLWVVGVVSFADTRGVSIIGQVAENFYWGAWDGGHSFWWYASFMLLNFGPVFLIFVLMLPVFWKRKSLSFAGWKFMYVIDFFLISITLVCRFTIMAPDMLKFYYFATIPMTIVSGFALHKLMGVRTGKYIVLAVMIIASFTSFLTLGWSRWNKNFAYSQDDMNAGMWIRSMTAPESVFVGYPTVHSPVTQIGGRLRLLSYTTWPCSHGYCYSEDNVFSRKDDIDILYDGVWEDRDRLILKKYRIDYLYLGSRERSEYREAERVLDGAVDLKPVYVSGEVKIYKFRTDGF